MGLHHYHFRSTWRLATPRDRVYAVLDDLASYPRWWPEVRSSLPRSDTVYDLRVRSLLPYAIDLTLTQARRDPVAGILEATLAGDLDGVSRWTLTAGEPGTIVVFEEDVVARRPLLRRLAVVVRPALLANHALMMRGGRRGLRAYLGGPAGGRRADLTR